MDFVPPPSAFIPLTSASNGSVFPSAAAHLQRRHLANGSAAPPGFTFTQFRVDDPLLESLAGLPGSIERRSEPNSGPVPSVVASAVVVLPHEKPVSRLSFQ